MKEIVACIDGSLGKGNLGDDGLLSAFQSEHRADFDRYFKMLSGDFFQATQESDLSIPVLFSGWRSFRTLFARNRAIRDWVKKVPVDAVHVSLGGLLGHDANVAVRAQILRMAESAGWRKCYYFGDIEPFCSPTKQLTKVFASWMGDDGWLSVRSDEAADLLIDRGYRGTIHVGVDPVLYERTRDADNLLVQIKSNQLTVALIPSSSILANKNDVDWWVSVTKAAKQAGLGINWCIFDSSCDIPAAQSIATTAGIPLHDFKSQIRFGQEAIHVSEQATICFTGRYHGAIFPITAGVPTVAQGWNAKIRRLYSMLGLEDWCSLDTEIKSDYVPNVIRWIRRAQDGDWQPSLTKLTVELRRHAESLDSFRSWVQRS